MQSFRTELENPIIEKDILDLEKKIRMFREGKIDDEKFRSLRLARGVYGQRQPGVQMIRIKIPYGKLSSQQLLHIADVADEYSDGNLHLTTRQDIQIHYVSLDKTPELWHKLEEEKITLREACGNTVRNITSAVEAGVHPDEVFDVSPYAQTVFEYFLRNPVCQEMGRKFKIAFSINEQDTALAFMHDLGFIPRIRTENGIEKRGFKVFIGGGLGAQPFIAEVIEEFLAEELIIPFTEAVLRIFDRYGERTRRHKARFKFLLNEVGLERVKELIQEEWKALKNKVFPIPLNQEDDLDTASIQQFDYFEPQNAKKYSDWIRSNVFEQKQKGFYAVYLKIPLGNISTKKARELSAIIGKYTGDEIRISINQGLMLKFVPKNSLPSLFEALDEIHLAESGFDATNDIVACPGTDTCNLGISNSTTTAKVLEELIEKEYPELVFEKNLKIKISGCPNSCGQHGIANIGFHGSSLKNGTLVLPALQVLLGGGLDANGQGSIADKVIKIPSKRALDCLRVLLDDYDNQALDGEYYNDYYQRQGKMYFYGLLKPLATLGTIVEEDYIDWGGEQKYHLQTAVGECAGVIIDLVSTLLFETEEKLFWSKEAFEAGQYADAIYHSYNAMISGAKAILLTENITTHTQHLVLSSFDTEFVEKGIIKIEPSFREFVLRVNQNEPTLEFATQYLEDAHQFLHSIQTYRDKSILTQQA